VVCYRMGSYRWIATRRGRISRVNHCSLSHMGLHKRGGGHGQEHYVMPTLRFGHVAGSEKNVGLQTL